jgi:hypothetical protein
MQINLPPPSPAKLARLEVEAAAHPIRYRVVLRTLALLGDVVLMLVRVLPLAFIPIVGAVITNNTFFYWVTGIAVPFLVWLVRPGRRDDSNPISPKEMPELYATVDRLKNEIDVDGRLQIELSDELEASAREVLGVFGLFGNRRLMTLRIHCWRSLDKGETAPSFPTNSVIFRAGTDVSAIPCIGRTWAGWRMSNKSTKRAR